MSKGICACCAVVAMLVCGTFANAAQPSASKMSQMGLGGAKVVSDSVSLQVRGQGNGATSRASASINQRGPSLAIIPVAVQVEGSAAGRRGAIGVSASGAGALALVTLGGQSVNASGATSAHAGR